MLKYIPYILLFCTCHYDHLCLGIVAFSPSESGPFHLLAAKGVSKVKKALRKKSGLTLKELEPVVKDLTAKQPFSRQQIAVTDPKEFLNSHPALYGTAKNDYRK